MKEDARKLLDRAVMEATFELHRQIEEVTVRTMGIVFRQTVEVRISRPRWMPERLYRWLMQQIVVGAGPLSAEKDR